VGREKGFIKLVSSLVSLVEQRWDLELEGRGKFLGIDCGTQGTKALVVDRDGVARGRGYAKHALIERESGAREQQPQWWVDAPKPKSGRQEQIENLILRSL
jgi:hypothetical protein